MAWTIVVKEAALDHLEGFGKKTGRLVLRESLQQLKTDPLAETKNMKTLRPNSVADRELRVLGKYRVLFSVDEEKEIVTVILAGEKRGSKLVVAGKEFSKHESHPPEQS